MSSRIDRLGSRSSWAGQRAIQLMPAFRPPRAFAMASAFIARLADVRRDVLGIVVRCNKHVGTRPLDENGEEAGNILGNLPSVVSAQITSQPRLPNIMRPLDEIVVCCVQ